MSMYRRPSKRVKCPPPVRGDKPVEGSFLYNIIQSKPPDVFKFKKAPIYKKEDYLKALKINHEQLGIPYIEPNIPDATPYVPPTQNTEPDIKYGDRVEVKLRVLKNGIVRVKVISAIADMYDKYYRHAKLPPIKVIIQAYKSHGFSDEFIQKIKDSHEKKTKFARKVPVILAKIFDKEPVKKTKKKKEEKKVEEEDEVPEDDLEEDQVPDEEGELDVEPDEEPEEVVEDDYYSEPDA